MSTSTYPIPPQQAGPAIRTAVRQALGLLDEAQRLLDEAERALDGLLAIGPPPADDAEAPF